MLVKVGKQGSLLVSLLLDVLTPQRIVTTRPAVELDLDEMKDIFAVNLFGVMDINQAFLPQLLLAKGTTVSIGSLAGTLPLPFNSVYTASKAALYAYCDCLRVELAPFGVKVTYVQTGSVKTNLFREQTHLKEGSLYAPISKTFEDSQEMAGKAGMDPAEFAKLLVGRILRGHSNVLWLGENAFTIRMLNALEYYLPFRIWPFIFSKLFGLDKLKVE
jgi:1-acylglycerone phosphate reductase